MADNKPEPQFSPDLVPRFLRSLGKLQPTHPTTSTTNPEQANITADDGRWMWSPKHKATAVEPHPTKLTHRGSIPVQARIATDNDAGPNVRSPQAIQTPIDSHANDGNVDSEDGHRGSPKPDTFAKRIQDAFSAIPALASNLGSPRSTPSVPPPETEVDMSPSPVRELLSPIFFTPPGSPSNRGWHSFRSAVDRLRPPFGKKSERGSPEPSRDEVLDCLDDNNSVMMYGPLEPDDSSQVEIACSEIVSVNGDGEEIRTPQPSYSPLPSECFDDALAGHGVRSPPPYFISLPLESIDQVLLGGGGGPSSPRGKENGVDVVSETADPLEGPPPSAEPAAGQLPVKEYRVWLPSLTKISVQTMWWGFRIYLPPPVLDVLNNRQLEAAKRAALITTALQWLMDHLPISLLPPQMHPGVAILRYLVPYVGYMGGFIAWGWSAIRSFDKGYGVVLTATWLLPFILIPGTWEADEVPASNTDGQVSPPVAS